MAVWLTLFVIADAVKSQLKGRNLSRNQASTVLAESSGELEQAQMIRGRFSAEMGVAAPAAIPAARLAGCVLAGLLLLSRP